MNLYYILYFVIKGKALGEGMGKGLQKLQTNTLDRHLSRVQVCEVPHGGWVAAIRKALNMSARQLACRLGVAQQSVARLERNEADASITLKSLNKAAHALDCRLVYALVPKAGSLEASIKQQALKKATELVKDVEHSMQLEAQGVGGVQAKVQELANDLAGTSRLWDE